MIFLTVGTQAPFDRLVEAVDSWAAQHPEIEVVAQIGDSTLRPTGLEWSPHLDPQRVDELFAQADGIVAHAGMGSILTALQLGKPILVMPRSASLGEHRNDHQIATARRFGELGSIRVAHDPSSLGRELDQLTDAPASAAIAGQAPPALLDTLRAFIHAD